jgi:nicotinate-nucleotide adenylyltransferase
MQNIGLFGGTFDPPHVGHVWMATMVLEKFKLDCIYFIPCRQSPHKLGKALTDGEHRLQMVRLATGKEKRFKVSRFELDQAGPSYSYKTVAFFRKQYPKANLFWILGSDQWEVLPKWAGYENLVKDLTFLVFPRPRIPKPRRGVRMKSLDLRIDTSSTEVRERLNHDLPTYFLLHPSVERYIRQHWVYRKK